MEDNHIEVIGVDHGWANCKTVGSVFVSGVKEISTETRYGFIAKTDMSEKAIKKAKTNLRAKIINIQKKTSYIAIENYNSAVRGIQNYYCIATNVYNNLTDVNYALLPTIRIRLRDISKTVPFRETDIEFQRKATGIKAETKIVKIGSQTLLPITGVHHRSPMNFSQSITSYTAKGRENIHSNLEKVTELEFEALAKCRDPNESIEFNDNRISAYVVQQGNCYISGQKLNAHDMKCIRKEKLQSSQNNELEYYEESIIRKAGAEAKAPLQHQERKALDGEDTITNRMLHWKYSKEQIAELKRAVAVKMPTEDILEFFYPEASTQQMREIVDTFYVLKQVYNNS